MAFSSAASQIELAGKAWRRLHPRRRRLPRPFAPRSTIGLEREYERELYQYLKVLANAVRSTVIPALPSLVSSQEFARPDLVRNDAAPDDIHALFRRAMNLVEEEYSEDELRALAMRKGMTVSQFNRLALARNLKKVIGIDPLFGDSFLANELALFTVSNVNLITSMRTEALARMETLTFEGFRAGRRAEEIARDIEAFVNPERGTVRARANLIARDQISKLNGQLTQLRQADLGVKRYRWRTVGDDRVRDSHRANDGKIFSWDDPPSETGHPGEDYQCRCYAEPVLEDVVPGLEEIEDE